MKNLTAVARERIEAFIKYLERISLASALVIAAGVAIHLTGLFSDPWQRDAAAYALVIAAEILALLTCVVLVDDLNHTMENGWKSTLLMVVIWAVTVAASVSVLYLVARSADLEAAPKTTLVGSKN